MKTIIKLFLVSLFNLFLFSGCEKFFAEDLSGQILGSSVLESQVGLESALTGAYKGLGNTWTSGFLHGPHVHVGMGADDRTGPASIDAGREFDIFTVSSNNTILNEIFRGCYKAIQGSNNVISNYKNTKGNPNTISIIAGEAYFLRAFSYYWLVRMWGDVPLILSADYKEDLLTIEKSKVSDIYAQIIEDLSQAELLLTDSRRNNEKGRPNRGSAKALLAEVYLTMGGWPLHDEGKYALAAIKAKEVIDNHSSFGFELVPTFAELWANDERTNGTTEDVFVITAFNQSGSRNQMYGYREMPGELKGWDCCYAEINFFLEFPDDNRKPVTFATEYPLLDGSRILTYDQLVTRHPFYKKFWIMAGNPAYYNDRTACPVVMMRYAHVLTIYAEAKARSSQADDLAYWCINTIRNRAGLDPLSSLPNEEFINAVIQERAWEFAGEATVRWFDLVRLEMVAEANSNRHPLEPVILTTMDESIYTFPFPLNDAMINPNL